MNAVEYFCFRPSASKCPVHILLLLRPTSKHNTKNFFKYHRKYFFKTHIYKKIKQFHVYICSAMGSLTFVNVFVTISCQHSHKGK